jgi:hypothetical protein
VSNGLRGELTAGEFFDSVPLAGGLSSTMCMRRRFLVGRGGDKGSKESSFTAGLGTCLSNGGLKGLFHIITLPSVLVRCPFSIRVKKREARRNANRLNARSHDLIVPSERSGLDPLPTL